MSAAAPVIGAPWSRSSRITDTCPDIAADVRADAKSSGVGRERVGVEVHVRRIVSAWSKSPSQVAALKGLLKASGSDGLGKGPRDRLHRDSAVWVDDDMLVTTGNIAALDLQRL